MIIYSTAEAAEILKVSQDHAKRLCQDSTFKHARKLGTCWAIPAKDVQAYLRKQAKKAKQKPAKSKAKRKANTAKP